MSSRILSRRILPTVAAVSVGAALGIHIEKVNNIKLSNNNNGESHFNFEVPTVAASAIVTKPQTPIQVGAARVSQIMKHGFPSLDNVRTFDDYVLSYDKRMRNPTWVFEHLTPHQVTKQETVTREKCNFSVDESVHPYFRATNEDYKGSGFDRGHLAAASNHRHDQKAMDQTFMLSNISPQVGKGFNRDAWNTLEQFTRHLTKKYGNVYVCSGPLYLPKRENDGKTYVRYQVLGNNNVAVPTHFFKVVVCETPNGQYELMSFVMPNQELPEKVDLKNYLVPLESIERAAGFLLFDKIPKNKFAKINGK